MLWDVAQPNMMGHDIMGVRKVREMQRKICQGEKKKHKTFCQILHSRLAGNSDLASQALVVKANFKWC